MISVEICLSYKPTGTSDSRLKGDCFTWVVCVQSGHSSFYSILTSKSFKGHTLNVDILLSVLNKLCLSTSFQQFLRDLIGTHKCLTCTTWGINLSLLSMYWVTLPVILVLTLSCFFEKCAKACSDFPLVLLVNCSHLVSQVCLLI